MTTDLTIATVESPVETPVETQAETHPETAAAAPAETLVETPANLYSREDREKARAIDAWMRDHGRNRSWLAAKMGTSGATVSTVLNLKYKARPSMVLAQMAAVIDVESQRLADGTTGYVEGSVHQLMTVVCDRTRKAANFGVMCGHVGVGKTRSAKEYAQAHPQTLLIESNPLMTPGSLLLELLEQLSIAAPAGMDRRFQAVVKTLAGTNHLLIVDEAENMSGQALHYLRRIRDKASVGVVLIGTEKLQALIKPEHGQFDQIRSRVAMWPATVKGITRDDMDDMARAALADGQDVPADVLEALWAYCDGSARVLNESLVPALRDYVIGKGQALTGRAVDAVAKSVLFMTRKSTARAA